jgi:hypothetical protein
MEYDPTNREKSKQTNKAKFWCGWCDGDLVGNYGKCGRCNRRQYSKKRKQK